jgi:hypothetical protein
MAHLRHILSMLRGSPRPPPRYACGKNVPEGHAAIPPWYDN